MKDGYRDKVFPVAFDFDDRVNFVKSWLKDERSIDEFNTLVKHIQNIMDAEDFDSACEAEEILLNLEAIVAYETGEFRGKDYWAEEYWDNFKRYYSADVLKQGENKSNEFVY